MVFSGQKKAAHNSTFQRCWETERLPDRQGSGNIDLRSVCPAELNSAELASGFLNPLGAQAWKPTFRHASTPQTCRFCQPVLDTELRNAAPRRPMKNLESSRVSSASSKAVARGRCRAPVSLRPSKRRLNIRSTENRNRCRLSDRNPR